MWNLIGGRSSPFLGDNIDTLHQMYTLHKDKLVLAALRQAVFFSGSGQVMVHGDQVDHQEA